MPAGAPLKVLLDGAERRSPSTGLTFHDLRGSAVARLALAGATVPQIAPFTGHSLEDAEAILDAHYLGRDIQLAEAAVLKSNREQNCKMNCKTRRLFESAKSLSA